MRQRETRQFLVAEGRDQFDRHPLVCRVFAVLERHEADRRFRNLLESAPDAMVVVDVPTRHIVLVNEQAERIFGVPRDSMLGESIGGFIDDPERLAAAMVSTYEDPNTRAWDVMAFNGHRPNGREFPVEVVLSRLIGHTTAQVVAGIRDVSLRRQAEDALRREREQARVTLQSIGDAVLTYDTALNVTSLNRVGEDITGWSRSESAGKQLGQIVHLYDSDDADAMPVQTDARRYQDGIYEGALVMRRDGQDDLRVEVSDSPLRDDDGGVIGGVMSSLNRNACTSSFPMPKSGLARWMISTTLLSLRSSM